MKWAITVEKVVNGYIIKPSSSSDGETGVVEIKDFTIKSEQLAFREVCYHLREFFAVNNDKHNDQYLDITVSGEDDEE